ncbi:radical SAM/SPASM domain-containing protein [Enterococcus innesii]|uniref:radical SAM/SPASM domain-containing protein n=1 Tax=Enterococcus TaxID=1350 RepID=UPI001897E9B7
MFWFNTNFLLVKEYGNKKFFLFNKISEEKEKMNEDMFNLLIGLSYEHIMTEEIIEYLRKIDVLDELIQKEVLVSYCTTKMDIVFIQENYSVNRIFLEVSQKCNLRCNHCYNESSVLMEDALSYSDIKGLIDNAKGQGCYIFQITGGEPLIRKDIEEIIDYIGRNGFKITIFTNLTFLPKRIVALLSKYSIKIVTSIDFIDPQKHDAFRGKTGALNTTIKNIKKLKNESIEVRVNMMIDNKDDNELESIINFLKLDLKVPYIADVIIPTGRGRNRNNLTELWENSFKYKQIAVDAVLNDHKLDLSKKIECNIACIYANDCGVGKSFLFVDSHGNVTICPSMRKTHNEQFWFGNLKEDSFETIMHNFKNKHINVSCKFEQECVYSKQCLGGCRSRAYHFLGDVQEVDPIMCSIYQNEKSEMMEWKNEIYR